MTGPLLIIGGTGLVGSAIIRESQKTYPIYALSRSANPDRSTGNVSFVKGDALDRSSLTHLFKVKPNVVHTVGTLIESNQKTYEKTNRDAALEVANAMAAEKPQGDRRCFVYFSAAHAPPGFILDERYLKTKREAENQLLAKRDEIRVVVLRPGIIYSYHRRQLMLPFALGLIVGSAILKPLSSYVPKQAEFLTDRPLSDTELSHAVFEALENKSVEGVYEIDRIRELAKAWGNRKQKSF